MARKIFAPASPSNWQKELESRIHIIGPKQSTAVFLYADGTTGKITDKEHPYIALVPIALLDERREEELHCILVSLVATKELNLGNSQTLDDVIKCLRKTGLNYRPRRKLYEATEQEQSLKQMMFLRLAAHRELIRYLLHNTQEQFIVTQPGYGIENIIPHATKGSWGFQQRWDQGRQGCIAIDAYHLTNSDIEYTVLEEIFHTIDKQRQNMREPLHLRDRIDYNAWNNIINSRADEILQALDKMQSSGVPLGEQLARDSLIGALAGNFARFRGYSADDFKYDENVAQEIYAGLKRLVGFWKSLAGQAQPLYTELHDRREKGDDSWLRMEQQAQSSAELYQWMKYQHGPLKDKVLPFFDALYPFPGQRLYASPTQLYQETMAIISKEMTAPSLAQMRAEQKYFESVQRELEKSTTRAK